MLMLRKQITRDVLLLPTYMLVSWAFAYELIAYLSPLQRPYFLVAAFMTSMSIAAAYDLKGGFTRYNISQALATVCAFTLAAIFAPFLHGEYNALMAEVFSMPGSLEAFGSDYAAAFQNKAVGYGGCYAASCALCRLFLHKWLGRLTALLFVSSEHMPHICSCCGQYVLQPVQGTARAA